MAAASTCHSSNGNSACYHSVLMHSGGRGMLGVDCYAMVMLIAPLHVFSRHELEASMHRRGMHHSMVAVTHAMYQCHAEPCTCSS